VPSASARSRSTPDFGNPYNGIGVYLMQQGKALTLGASFLRASAKPRAEA